MKSKLKRAAAFLCSVCFMINLMAANLTVVSAADGPPAGKYLSEIAYDSSFTSSSYYSQTGLYDTDFYNTIKGSSYSSSYTTEATALEISTPGQLAAFAKAVNTGGKDFSGKFVRLTADINLAGTHPTVTYTDDGTDKFKIKISGACTKTWIPIGSTSGQRFAGTFDGANHVISNMVVCQQKSGGLFGACTGTIKNVGVKDSVVAASGCAGGIAGSSTGGIIGCYNTSCIFSSFTSGNGYVGGIAGSNSGGSISGCYNTGYVYCYTSAISEYSPVHVGGVAGTNSGDISECYNTGSVYSSSTSTAHFPVAGGITGHSTGNISGCYNIGGVASYSTISDPGTGSTAAGGIVGTVNSRSSAKVSYCYSAVTSIIANGGRAFTGGVIGKKDSGTVSNSYYDATLVPDITAINGTDDTDTVKGLPTAQMQGNATGMTGFSTQKNADGTNMWRFASGRYPTLTACPPPKSATTITMGKTAFTYGGINCAGANWQSTFGITSSRIDAMTFEYKTGSGSYTSLPTSGYFPAGNYTLKVTQPENDDYLAGTLEKAFTVAKATPSYTTPTGLTATYGQKLSELASGLGTPKGVDGSDLEGTWSWAGSSTPVGDAGTDPRTHSATFTPADTTNYNSVTKTISVTVNKATPSYEAPTDLTATYGQTLSDVTLPLVDNGTWNWANPSNSVGDAGTDPRTHSATFTPKDTENYEPVTTDVNITVKKATPSYTAPTDLRATYGQKLSALVSDLGKPTGVDGKALEGTWSWTGSSTLVGDAGTDPRTHSATFTPTDTTNYNSITATISVQVAKATPSYAYKQNALQATVGETLGDLLSASGLNRWFGLPTGVAGASLGGNWNWQSGITDDTLVGEVTGPGEYNEFLATYTPADENKNNYAWEALTDYWDQEASVLTAKLQVEVSKNGIEGIEIKLNPSTATYNGTEQKPDIEIVKKETSSTLSENTDYTIKYPDDMTNAGPKPITIEFKGEYEGKTTKSFVIEPKPITVTANNVSKNYGGAEPELTYKADGLVGKDKLEGQLSRQSGEDAGTYEITQGSLNNPNYSIKFTPGKFTISKSQLEYEVPTGLTATYGQTLNAVGLPTAGNGTWSWVNPSDSVGNAGTREHSATFTPADTKNYGTVTENISITVNKANPSYVYKKDALQATVGQTLGNVLQNLRLDLNKLFGLPTGVAGASLGGNWAWKSGITNDTLVGDATKSGKYNEFAAIYTPTDENKNNYNWEALKEYWSQEASALTAKLQVEVIRREIEGIEIKLSQSEFVYDGTEKMPVLTVTKEDTKEHLAEGKDYGVVYPEDRINAGRKQIKLKFKGSYEGEVSRFFTIAPKEITVKADDASKTCGEPDPELTYTVDGLIGKGKLEGKLSRAEGEDVGTYEISQGELNNTKNPNYDIKFTKGTFTIIGNKTQTVVTLSEKEITLKAGQTHRLTAKTSPAAAENEPLVWTSDNPAVAQVSTEGEAKGIAPGTATITVATADGKSQDSCVVTVEVDKSSWGERVERNEIEMYVDDKGTTSVESSKNGIIWAKEELPENQTWYGLDNRNGDFTQGSRFWVRGINKKENPEEWQEYWAQVDEEYKVGINEEQCWIFLVGVTNPNGEEYEQLEKPTNLYVQIGDNWDYENLQGLYISSKGNENINVRYASDEEYPEDSGAFCVMELNHFSPYLVYTKSAKEGPIEQEKVDVPKKEISKTEQKENSKEVKKSRGFQTGDEVSYVQISAIVINLFMSFYMLLKFKLCGKKWKKE